VVVVVEALFVFFIPFFYHKVKLNVQNYKLLLIKAPLLCSAY
jgi:hypothetical protein